MITVKKIDEWLLKPKIAFVSHEGFQKINKQSQRLTMQNEQKKSKKNLRMLV